MLWRVPAADLSLSFGEDQHGAFRHGPQLVGLPRPDLDSLRWLRLVHTETLRYVRVLPRSGFSGELIHLFGDVVRSCEVESPRFVEEFAAVVDVGEHFGYFEGSLAALDVSVLGDEPSVDELAQAACDGSWWPACLG